MGVRLYRIQGTKMQTFIKKVKHSSIWSNGIPDGWICGWPFIGYINSTINSHGGVSKELYLLISTSFFKKQIDDINIKDEKSITFYEREGNFWRLEYTNRRLTTTAEPT
jgi:hypothetical protein